MLGNVDEWCQDDWNSNAYMLFMADPTLEKIKVEGLKPGFNPSKALLSDWKVVRGGGLRHSTFISSHRDRFGELTAKQKNQFFRETIDVGERNSRGRTDYYLVGFRCAMDN